MGTPPESLLTWPLSLDGYSSNELSSSLHFFFFFSYLNSQLSSNGLWWLELVVTPFERHLGLLLLVTWSVTL